MIQTLLRRGRALWLQRQWRRPLLASTMLVSLGLILAGLISGWHELIRSDWRFDWVPLLLSSFAYAISLILTMTGWSLIMRGLRVQATWRQNAKFYLYSWMARRLPTPAPYLASRVLLYEEIGVPKRLISVGLIWENVLLIAASATLVLLMLPLSPLISGSPPQLSTLLTIIVVLAVGASITMIVYPKLLGRVVNWALRRLSKPELEVGLRPAVTLGALAIYTTVWFTGGLIVFFLIRSMYPLDWSMLPYVVQSWALSGLISYVAFFAPISFGIREVTLASLLWVVVPAPVAILIVLLTRLWNMMNELLWAFIVYKL